MAALFSELLGMDQVGRGDSFFALGGGASKVARLLELLRERLGWSVPPMMVYETSTVERLSAWLDAASSQQTRQEAAARPGALDERSLVRLMADGAKRPWFLMHPASGMPFAYAHLQRFIDHERPVYASTVSLERQKNVRSFEERAAIHVAEIRKIQPEGPYLLGGWSYGGVLAYEVGRQLTLGGAKVSRLLVFDPGPPSMDLLTKLKLQFGWALERIATEVWPPYRCAGRLLRRMNYHPPSRGEAIDLLTGDVFPDPIARERVEALSFDELFELLEERLRAHLPPPMLDLVLQRAAPWMQHGAGLFRAMKIHELNSSLSRRYAPAWKHTGKITFFAYSRWNWTSMWQARCAAQPMDVRFVDLQPIGGLNPHAAMFMPENLKLFAEQLREVLSAEP